MTSILLEDSIRYPYFHSTAPNDVYLSRVVIELMEHFSWQKVAILSTQDESSVSVSTLFSLCHLKIIVIGFTNFSTEIV